MSDTEEDQHWTTVESVSGEWEWSCSCGEEATGFEDEESCEASAEEHAR